MQRWIIAAALIVLMLIAFPAQAGEVAERLAVGIETWKRADANGRWWSCGKIQSDGANIAKELAERIERESEAYRLNPWGLAGVIAKESKFDECALGKRSRDFGYREGILKPRRLTISHAAADVLAVLASKAWKKEIGKADIGLPQVMYPTIYKGDPAALLTREIGVRFAAEEMARRVVRIGTVIRIALLRPWGSWPGWYDTKYDKSIVRHARALGATVDDLSDVPRGRNYGLVTTTAVR